MSRFVVPFELRGAFWLATACLVACGEGAATPSTDGQGGASSNGGAGGSSGAAQAGASASGTSGKAGASSGGSSGSAAGGAVSSGGESTGGGGVSGGSGSGGSGGSTNGGSAGSGGGVTADPTYVPDPSWACGAPEGLNSPMRGKPVFTAALELGATHDVGKTQYGARKIRDIKGGTVSGEKLQATVLTGGLDLELTLSNGAIELEQLNVLKASDGTLIYLRSCGMAPPNMSVRFVPDFEVASSSSLAWLNTGKFVGTRVIDQATGKMQIVIYDVAGADKGPELALHDPAGVPHQPWDCSTLTGQKGDTVFTETVGIGSSLAVGASKRGTRNIIPITGGTVSGRVTGKVLAGGADYQLVGGKTTLDARYTLAADDGNFIIIRNCGAFGAMVPQFEARADGPYAFLNTGSFLSSDPGSAAGGVSLTMYERK